VPCRDESAAQQRQKGEEHGRVAGGLNAFCGQAERGGETHEREQEQHPGRGHPDSRAGRRGVSDREGDAEHDGEPRDRCHCWSLGIAIVSYLWAVRLYNRRRAADPK
jgi:hypothetical protein